MLAKGKEAVARNSCTCNARHGSPADLDYGVERSNDLVRPPSKRIARHGNLTKTSWRAKRCCEASARTAQYARKYGDDDGLPEGQTEFVAQKSCCETGGIHGTRRP